MAVEARHLNIFPSQILSHRETMMNSVEGMGNVNGTPMEYRMVAPISEITTATETMVPMIGSTTTGNAPPKTVAIKSDSGLTYAVPASRKRSRDAFNPPVSSLQNGVHNQMANNSCGSFSFLGEDFSFQFLQQQLEIDRFIAHHAEKLRVETEERRKRFCRRIAATMEENIVKKLKAKEEEMDKIGKLNMALEERVKSLCVENQLWRDLARANEATANALRCDLEQVQAQVQDERQQQHEHRHGANDAALTDDAESCCGSNLAQMDRVEGPSVGGRNRDYIKNTNGGWGFGPSNSNRTCRSCGNDESSVLLLPCRHLCLCSVCGSCVHTCPVCNSAKTASVHVNLSAF